ncbi:AAA family ATPase [Catenuloplanes atrovinosus]|uniref:Kinase n=1 Tax=Catenuloplanes atrovinosus TaxID=137266 RepID=A0AAE3YTD0_9ACTN|nr:ATP-binding protein [Catenuloplanes atrovinosus]MDR7278282.1 putative kinase [Catenuloplanes atrovinosus]
MTARPVLIVFAGLPGVGKSTLARRVGAALPAPVLPVDPIERAFRSTGPEAYRAVASLAELQLDLGLPVVVDAVNPAVESRELWLDLADRAKVPLRVVEVWCGDQAEHRRRVEARQAADPAYAEVDWVRVLERRAEYQPYVGRRVVVDTTAPGDPLRSLLDYLRA